MARNLQVTLVSRPVGEPKESYFAFVAAEMPEELGELYGERRTRTPRRSPLIPHQ